MDKIRTGISCKLAFGKGNLMVEWSTPFSPDDGLMRITKKMLDQVKRVLKYKEDKKEITLSSIEEIGKLARKLGLDLKAIVSERPRDFVKLFLECKYPGKEMLTPVVTKYLSFKVPFEVREPEIKGDALVFLPSDAVSVWEFQWNILSDMKLSKKCLVRREDADKYYKTAPRGDVFSQ